jgi:ADP-ribose pyrophosphatase YjhB (NUDIX family)
VKPFPVIGVGAIVFRGDEVLLVRRRRPPAAGRWSFPGGRVRPGERLRAACRRELREETGLSLRLGRTVGVFERIADGWHYVIVDFLAEAPRGARLRPGSDASGARWVSPSELRRLRTTPGLSVALATARRARKAR